MTSTHRAENIFPKYLLYSVHEIARKYPREKYRYSSFSDSVSALMRVWIFDPEIPFKTFALMWKGPEMFVATYLAPRVLGEY